MKALFLAGAWGYRLVFKEFLVMILEAQWKLWAKLSTNKHIPSILNEQVKMLSPEGVSEDVIQCDS